MKNDELGADWKQRENKGGFLQANQRSDRSSQYSSGEQFDDSNFSDFFENIFGRKSGDGNQRQSVSYNGQDFNAQFQLTLQKAYYGARLKRALEKNHFSLK